MEFLFGRSKGPCDVFGSWVRWEGSGWDLRIRPTLPAPAAPAPAASGPKPGPQLGPKPGPKPGPSRAQAGPKLGAQKIQKIKILKIKIRVAQNVGKVWISRKKIPLAPFHAIS